MQEEDGLIRCFENYKALEPVRTRSWTLVMVESDLSKHRASIKDGGLEMGNTPIYILKEGTEREKGKDAQHSNIEAARTVANAVKSTLGPRGMDKMLVDGLGDVVITNDGATILKDLDVQHPAAKMVVEVSKALDEECGDGTTTAAVLVGELLKNALGLIESNIHPTIIANGYRMAADKAMEILEEQGIPVGEDDIRALKNVATTAMMSKAITVSRDHMADTAVEAVKSIIDLDNDKPTVDLTNIQIVKKEGGATEDTGLVKGVVIEKAPSRTGMPHRIDDAKIALISSALEVKKTELSAEVQITEPLQMKAFLKEEEHALAKMADGIGMAGANVIFCQKGIDDRVKGFLMEKQILAVEKVKGSDMAKLARATGGNIVNLTVDLNEDDMGTACTVEIRRLEDEEMTFVIGCLDPRSVSILIRGGTQHVVDEIERSLDDALNVVRLAVEDGKIVTGGGSVAIELAMQLKDYAASIKGREQIAIDAFSDALEIVPTTLAENAGLDPIDILIDMRKAHQDGERNAGVDVFTGNIVDMRELNVIEPIRVDRQIINSATEAAIMILRIDDVISAKGGGQPGGVPDQGGY